MRPRLLALLLLAGCARGPLPKPAPDAVACVVDAVSIPIVSGLALPAVSGQTSGAVVADLSACPPRVGADVDKALVGIQGAAVAAMKGSGDACVQAWAGEVERIARELVQAVGPVRVEWAVPGCAP